MKLSFHAAILLWLLLVGASNSASNATQSVDVGEHGLSFDPDTIHVASGGKVEFHFYPGNHSVTQASFDDPCHPMSDTSFFSGFIQSANGESSTVFTLTVNDTKPIWFYCGQIGHCQAGMVGVINPATSGPDTLDAFKKAASNANGDSVPSAFGHYHYQRYVRQYIEQYIKQYVEQYDEQYDEQHK
ncbi:Cupredoxin [Aspergillus pseudonomiae]|uniref:Cupredoxin n=1 Tax=Aspergillus pseudonomiae TaxID=1506151 RepID=A0A5N7DJD5_9EURO|nr:Cupredoxin [Aspergillus pseudonomiae]KAE8406454.1 Cupredoxin [Aspergillus pseudonomiae]